MSESSYTAHVTVETYVDNEEAAAKIIGHIISDQGSPTAHVQNTASYYWWEGKLVQERETKISFDLPASKAPDIIDKILEVHPYDLPAITLRPLLPGTVDTAKWLADPNYTG